MLLQVFSIEAISKPRSFERFKHFQADRESIEENQPSGGSTTGVTPKNLIRVRENIQNIAEAVIRDFPTRLSDQVNMIGTAIRWGSYF